MGGATLIVARLCPGGKLALGLGRLSRSPAIRSAFLAGAIRRSAARLECGQTPAWAHGRHLGRQRIEVLAEVYDGFALDEWLAEHGWQVQVCSCCIGNLTRTDHCADQADDSADRHREHSCDAARRQQDEMSFRPRRGEG
jgi:hypothetical protein